MTFDKILFESSRMMMRNEEEFIRLHVKDTPWWMPKFIWNFLIKKMLILAVFRGKDPA